MRFFTPAILFDNTYYMNATGTPSKSNQKKNLVIVESPAKAKTIGKFLGSDFLVLSSYGHIRDLKSSSFSIDIENNFTPDYEIPEDKKKVVKELQEAVKKSETVWLASDEDREGEAIAWHLYETLELDKKTTKRIAFHEITEKAIQTAIQNPRDIDVNLVDAQQARRVLDRIVGFELSPVLWRRIKSSLSAGRVQSVAVRLVVDREREIQEFVSQSSYKIEALFVDQEGNLFTAICGKEYPSQEEAQDAIRQISQGSFVIQSVERKPGKRTPAAPFTTSTLQQEAARKLGFPVARTMSIAQKLYEQGHITYMRTDSVALSQQALEYSRQMIESTWGANYHKRRTFKTKSKGAQEAHEAIRPTFMTHSSAGSTAQEKSLYDLIWKRTIASQMAEARLEKTVVTMVPTGDAANVLPHFTATGEVILFDGFIKVYQESKEDEVDEALALLPNLKEGDALQTRTLTAQEKYSRAPARYSEASLVRKMEELGIGRPSTYAPTIQTIQSREYVKRGDNRGKKRTVNTLEWSAQTHQPGETPEITTKTELYGNEKGRLLPTDIGLVVNDYLVEHFPKVIDYNFTADVEEQFDRVASGSLPWQELISNFYSKFHPVIEQNMESSAGRYSGERTLGKDPKTGQRVSVRIGRYGPMVQMGETDAPTGKKPSFASLPSGLSIATITLEEALKLFQLPRKLGQWEGAEVSASIGRFGPYVKHVNTFASIPSELDPYTITFNDAVGLLQAKKQKEAASILKTFAEDDTLTVRSGRYGAYIKQGRNNYKIVNKEQKEAPQELSYEEVLQIIATAQESSKNGKRRSAAKRKTTTTAATTKSATASKAKKAAATKTATKKQA